MKPKDLLDDLESGDRTIEHLKEEPSQTIQATWNGLGNIILSQQMRQQQQWFQAQTITTGNTGIGGILQW